MDTQEEFAKVVSECEADRLLEERWEKKRNTTVSSMTRLYLMEKANAVARGRITAREVAQTEDMLAWGFQDYSELEMDALAHRISRLVHMGSIDDRAAWASGVQPRTVCTAPKQGNKVVPLRPERT